jgi:diaminopimelate epimerase
VTIAFKKYQATGNDFILIDNRNNKIKLSTDQIQQLCDRKFGVGADGLILIENHEKADFNVIYYNPDGSQSLCGNGSRAAVHLARSLGLAGDQTKFNAFDGIHDAFIASSGLISVKMMDVSEVKAVGEDYFLNTGSPHHIRFISKIETYPVYEEGRKVRYSEQYQPAGCNVNFVELLGANSIYVRTYERGVENETLSCGTGVTAAALAASLKGYKTPIKVKTKGGELEISFKSEKPNQFHNIFLSGPAKMVFEGRLEL